MHLLNVRCCCQPKKILGTLDLPTLNRVQTIVVAELPKASDAVDLAVSLNYENIELKDFVDCRTGAREMELAVYSDDKPIDFWRKFKGFIEAPADTW